MKIRVGATILCVMLLPADRAAPEAPPDAVVVTTVNGEAIYLEHVERELAAMHATAETQRRSDFDLDRLIFRLVSNTLLAQEARALGMHEEAPIPQRLRERREEMARRRLEEEEISSRVEISDEAVLQAYADAYRTVTFWILTVEEQVTAEALLARLEAGEESEAIGVELAAAQSGHRRVFDEIPKVNVPMDIARVIGPLEPGAIGGPFLTNLGWSIASVLERAEADPANLSQYEGRIRSLLRYDQSEALRADLTVRLDREIVVSVDREVADIDCEILPDGRLRPRVEDPDAVVATIGDRAVTAREFGRALLTRWRSMRSRDAALASREIILDEVIRHEMLNAEAVRRGYDRTPEVEREISAYLTELLVPRFLKEVLGRSIEISEEDKRTFYEENRDRFRRLPRMRFSRITVASSEEAETVVRLLRESADLDWVVQTHSLDETKKIDGDQGWIVPTQELGMLQDELLRAQPGSVLGPFPEGDGRWTVIRVDGREEQAHYEYRQVSGNVREAVFAMKFRQRLDEVLGALRESSEIVVHEDVLATLELSGSIGRQGGHGSGSDGHGQDGH